MASESSLPVDRGWAWVILFAVTFTQFLFVGTLKSFGIFFVEILEEFKESVSVTSLINGIQSVIYCLVSLPLLLCGIRKFGVRKAVITGSTLVAIGYGISAVAYNIDFLYFSISVLIGAGSGFLYSPSLVILSQYFEKRRGIATGIAISGGCLGSLVLPPFYRFLLDVYGLRGALLLTGGLLFHNTAMACFLRPITFYQKENNNVEEKHIEQPKSNGEIHTNTTDENTLRKINTDKNGIVLNSNIKFFNGEKFSGSHPVISKSSPLSQRTDLARRLRVRTCSESNENALKSSRESLSSKMSLATLFKYISLDDITAMSVLSITEVKDADIDEDELQKSRRHKCCNLSFAIFRNPSFVLFLISHVFASITPVLFPSFLPAYMKENSLTNEEIVILVSVLGASDFVGRISSGYFTDKPWIKKYQIIIITQGFAGIVLSCSSLITTFWAFVIYSILVGVSAGGIFAVVLPALADIIGMEQFQSGLAFLIITQGPALAISSPVFGFIRDHTGSYDASFKFLGSMSLIAAAILFIEPIIQRCKPLQQTKDVENLEETESLKAIK